MVHVNLRDKSNLSQQEAIGVLGVNLLHAVLNHRAGEASLPARLFDDLAEGRIEVDQLDFCGGALADERLRDLHIAMARDGFAEAVMLDVDGAVAPANEFLYKKAVVIAPASGDPRDELLPEDLAACVEALRREIAGHAEVKEVIGVRLLTLGPELRGTESASLQGAAMLTRDRPLYHTTSYIRRYTQAPLRFALPLPALMRIFDEARYGQLEGRLLEGIAKHFGSDVRVLAYPYRRKEVHRVLLAEPGHGWEVNDSDPWVAADRLLPAPPLCHLYEYLLASGFLKAMPTAT